MLKKQSRVSLNDPQGPGQGLEDLGRLEKVCWLTPYPMGSPAGSGPDWGMKLVPRMETVKKKNPKNAKSI